MARDPPLLVHSKRAAHTPNFSSWCCWLYRCWGGREEGCPGTHGQEEERGNKWKTRGKTRGNMGEEGLQHAIVHGILILIILMTITLIVINLIPRDLRAGMGPWAKGQLMAILIVPRCHRNTQAIIAESGRDGRLRRRLCCRQGGGQRAEEPCTRRGCQREDGQTQLQGTPCVPLRYY